MVFVFMHKVFSRNEKKFMHKVFSRNEKKLVRQAC
jgi:hypothetical protein